MSNPDGLDLRPLHRMDGEPTFDEAWQARTIALISELTKACTPLTRLRWAEALGEALGTREEPAGSDQVQAYYDTALALVEALLCDSAVLTKAEIDARVARWVRAYDNTAHGSPVLLSAAD